MKRYLEWLDRGLRVLLVGWLVICAGLFTAVVYTGTVDAPVPADVIVVLGASVTDRGEPGKALTRRSAHAAALWSRGLAGAIICTGGFGRDLPVRRSEADACREVLMRAGVPRAAIVLEEASRNTEENGEQARSLMTARGWRTALLVSDSYHVFRARYLFRRLGIEVVASPVPVARVGSPLFYVMSVLREVAALQWHAVT